MRIALLLPSIFGAGLVQEAYSALRLSTHAVSRGDPTLDEIGQELDDAGKQLEKAHKKAMTKAQRGPAYDGNAKKPMMDNIEVMRAMMCWGRKKLIEHEDCMSWMVKNCKKETSGEGYCRKLRRYIKSKCRHGNEKGCAFAQDLGIEMAKDKEVIADDDQDGDGVSDKDDAFPDNPLESKDSDGDMIGDNSDEFPEDETRAHKGEVAGAPSPAVAAAPSAPTGLKMGAVGVPLPSQGYNEHSVDYVSHSDRKTMTQDWRAEWPMSGGDDHASVKDICAENPHYKWCKLKRSKAARRAYARSHP